MKKVLLCALSVVFLFACGSSKLIVKDNPFNNSKDIELRTWHKVIEGNMDNQEAIYTASVKNGKRTPTTVKFHFRIGAMGIVANPFARYKNAPLDPEAQLLVDNTSYKLKLFDTQKDTTLTIHGSGGSVYGGTYNDLYCSVTLTPEIERTIPNCSKVMYRFSAGGEATTMIAKPDQLNKLKSFFSVK